MEAQNLKEDAKDILNHAGDYAETFYKLKSSKAYKKSQRYCFGRSQFSLNFFYKPLYTSCL